MSLRSMKIPGQRLGLGTFINTDLDAKRRIVYFGNITLGAASVAQPFTQAQTRMATIECVLTARSIFLTKASASIILGNSTLTNGTVYIRMKPAAAGAANTNKQAFTLHYWMVGTPDPQRIVI